MIKKNKINISHIALAIVLIIVFVVSALLGYNYGSEDTEIDADISPVEPVYDNLTETEGMNATRTATLYVDGAVAADESYDDNSDLKRIIDDGNISRLINYNDGYQLDFPSGTVFDFSLSEKVIRGYGDDYIFTVSCERSPYTECNDEMTAGIKAMIPEYQYDDGVDQYIGYYESRFLLNEEWQKNNDITVTDPQRFDANGYAGIMFHADLNNVVNDNYNAFSYIYLKTGGEYYIRVAVKYYQDNTELRNSLPGYYNYLRFFDCSGEDGIFTDYSPVIPDNWSDETTALYKRISESDAVTWGIYTSNVYDKGINSTIPDLEEKLNYHFPVVLSYVHSGTKFPSAFMEKNWNNGRIVELTYQITDNNNTDLCASSQVIDIYRGIDIESIRSFAKAAKKFGHSFIFRLCNEMNSDWCSYSGVANMADPEVFIYTWQTIYNIFREEGVDNCIWVFNPNDRDCPPTNWNDSLLYYPGDEYVQIIGITGYNNGTYYEKWSEEWREFDAIYDYIQDEYQDVFGEFPWMITEFASSSIGGDKSAWIDNMFDCIENYPNIKIMVWFNEADYDTDGTVARPYWLDETEETTAAFKRGLKDYSDASLMQ